LDCNQTIPYQFIGYDQKVDGKPMPHYQLDLVHFLVNVGQFMGMLLGF
jgi:hypothetical protein